MVRSARLLRRALALLLCVVVCVACTRRPPPPLPERVDAAIARGAAFLLSRQGADGAIRAETYPYFRDGYSLTPLALAALFALPDDRHAAAYARGVDFVATLPAHLEEARYPLYAMALGAIVLSRPGNERHAAARDALVAELRRRQLGPELGWRPEDLSFGGWGYVEDPRRPERPDEAVASNLSATLLAASALGLSGVPATDPALVHARVFVERCQAADGGFFFSPAIPDGNKAGPGRAYGSMTADGTRALLRLGVAPTDPRVASAAAWLERHFDATRNPGDFLPVNEQRRGSSYFYWTWSAAHAMRVLGKTGWADALATELLARQRPDGSWANAYTEMREDDPVVATSFAIAALGVSRLAMGAPYRTHAGTASPPAP